MTTIKTTVTVTTRLAHDVFDDMDAYRFHVATDTETTRWVDSGRVRFQTTRYYVIETETGDVVGKPFQNAYACRNVCLSMHRQAVKFEREAA